MLSWFQVLPNEKLQQWEHVAQEGILVTPNVALTLEEIWSLRNHVLHLKRIFQLALLHPTHLQQAPWVLLGSCWSWATPIPPCPPLLTPPLRKIGSNSMLMQLCPVPKHLWLWLLEIIIVLWSMFRQGWLGYIPFSKTKQMPFCGHFSFQIENIGAMWFSKTMLKLALTLFHLPSSLWICLSMPPYLIFFL